MYIHCSKCKSAATVPIVYGKPTYETMEAGKYGLIHIAGCLIDDERINRHCKACGCDFISDENGLPAAPHKQVITTQEMTYLLNDLEQDLKVVHQNIEREYMRLGRESKAEVSYAVFEYLRDYHTAWDIFLDRLHQRGDPTVVVGYDGRVVASYSNNTARVYLIKNYSSYYLLLAALAQACYRLGHASREDNIDELKDASIAVQRARENIAKTWDMVCDDAISRSD